MERRNVLLTGTAVVSAFMFSGMSGCPQNVDVIKTVADFIQAVQQGVVTAIKQACNTATAYVPTIDTVLSVAASILGVTGIVTGNIADAVKNLQKIIDTIVATGCPSPGPPAPSASFQGVPIVFYK